MVSRGRHHSSITFISHGTDGGNISDTVATPKASAVLLGEASGLGGGPGGHVDFLSPNNTIVRAHAGSTVTMACVVEKESQFGMITWTRQLDPGGSKISLTGEAEAVEAVEALGRDVARSPALAIVSAAGKYQILTIAEMTHISDDRFIITSAAVNNDWSLKIIRVSMSDSGVYKCQANSHPPQFIRTTLKVQEAFARIGGARERFVKTGSTLQLNCTLHRMTSEPDYIFWYHNNRMVNHDINFDVTFGAGHSTLAVLAAGHADTGNYSCAPHNLVPDSVIVHVLEEGSNSAAAIHDAGDDLSAAAAAAAAAPPASSRAVATVVVVNRSFQPSIGIFFSVVVSAIVHTR